MRSDLRSVGNLQHFQTNSNDVSLSKSWLVTDLTGIEAGNNSETFKEVVEFENIKDQDNSITDND